MDVHALATPYLKGLRFDNFDNLLPALGCALSPSLSPGDGSPSSLGPGPYKLFGPASCQVGELDIYALLLDSGFHLLR